MEDIRKELIQHSKDIAILQESARSAHRRIDENDQITQGIHKLATNVETLALQVKSLTDKLDTSVSKLEQSLKTQGERIGALEGKAGKRWEAMLTQILSLIIAAVFGLVMAKLGGL